eukprot:XP_017457706.1 PREDICTED: odorant-binding protein-like [Rattus norvegicus]
MDNTCQSQANNQYYIRWRWLWVFPPPVLGLRTPSEAENPGSNMVKFLLIVLALGVSCAHHENLDISPSEVNGDWRTLYIVADNVEKVAEGGSLRAYFQHMECGDECQELKIIFNVKLDSECQTHTVVGQKHEDGRYTTDYSGRNYFHVLKKTDDIIFFHNVNVDESGKETNVILVAGESGLYHRVSTDMISTVTQ